MLMMFKRFKFILSEQGEKELTSTGVDENTLGILINEGINNIPYSKVIEGKEADEFFVLSKGTEYTYCIVGNFIGLVVDQGNEIWVHEVPNHVFEGCTAAQINLILEGSKEAPFSIKERLQNLSNSILAVG